MSNTLSKWTRRLGAATSLGLVASFGYFATGDFGDDTNTVPPAPNGPTLSEEFQRESHTGSPLTNVPRPLARPAAEPITVNLGNGFGLHFQDNNLLFSSADRVNHAMYDAEYDNHVSKSPELHTGLMALSAITPMSYQAFEAAVWKETRFQEGAENSSGAKGFFQMKPEAFYEGLYRLQGRYESLADITNLVERTREKVEGEDSYILGYEPVSNEASAQLDRYIHDPLIGGLAYYSYLEHYMENFVQEKIPELTKPNQTDLYLISFRGPGGATEFLQNLRNNPDSPAHDMYEGGAEHPFVSQNKSVYYNSDNDHWRSYRQVYDYIADDMHIGRAPVSFSGDENARNHAVSITPIEPAAQANIIAPDSLIFAENIPRPQPRPALLFAGDQNDTRQAGMAPD